MRRVSLAVALMTALLLAFSGPVAAVQFGTPDGDDHPQVGLMVNQQYNDDGNLVPMWRCSGTLISATVFLTAAHCVEDADLVVIWFDGGPVPLGAGYPASATDPCAGITGYPCTGDVTGTGYAHPNWTGSLTVPGTYDIGVVVLDAPQSGVEYAELAPEGTMDAFSRSTAAPHFDLVGYGVQDTRRPFYTATRTRYFGHANLINTKSSINRGYNIQLTAAPGTGGSLCFGDSGGPVFLHDSLTIVAVNSFVFNTRCMGSGFSYRTDTADSLAFINSFLD